MIRIIADDTSIDQQVQTQISFFFNRFQLSKLMQRCNFYKESGVPCIILLKELFGLVFTGKNLYRTLETCDDLPFRKNTAYRFLNAAYHNWEKLLLLIASQLVAYIDSLTGNDRESVLILDDSLFSRNRSKQVELLAKVYDHTTHRFHRGYRMLTLGWSDGNTFLPVSFQLLSSQKKENILSPAKPVDGRTLASKRRKRACSSTTDVLIEMLKAAKHLPARFVLFDSWFTTPKTVVRVKNEQRDVIGMLRLTEKIHYQFQGQWQNVKGIYQQVPLTTLAEGKRLVGSACVRLREHKNAAVEDYVDARIVFVKDLRSNAMAALLCTDLNLSEEEIIRIYGKRWDIEVFFKVCKSYLALTKEYQGRSYDLQVAATTLVFLRYTMLAMQVREATDDRTVCELFYQLKDEMKDIVFIQALMRIMYALKAALKQSPLVSMELVDQIMNVFLSAVPDILRGRLLAST